MPKTLPGPEYPKHLEVRRVSNAGTMRFRKRPVFVSQALVQEDVAFEETRRRPDHGDPFGESGRVVEAPGARA